MNQQQPIDQSLLDLLAEQRELLNEMLAGVPFPPDVAFDAVLDEARTALTGNRTPLDAEMWGSEMLGMLALTGLEPAAIDETFSEAVVPAAEQEASPDALAMLRVLGAIGSPALVSRATAAAERVAAQGVADKRWAAKIGNPSVGECWVYGDPSGFQESVTITFGYARKRHALSVLIDHGLGSGVKDSWISDDPSRVLAETRALARDDPSMIFEMINAADAHSRLQPALAAKECPQLPDQIEDVALTRALLRTRVATLAEAGTAARPARKRAAGRGATVHRLKVALRGSKPPIWRRLEVRSDIPLRELHETIQRTFDWSDCHLHVFETGRGDFGEPDPELGHSDDRSVRLARVAPAAGGRLRYTYDFGDDWEHTITVEHVGPADPDADYPRCTGGRRACPPEDCGGIGGYEELLDVIADPDHAEHADMAEWLAGMRSEDFDPAAFDVSQVNARLQS